MQMLNKIEGPFRLDDLIIIKNVYLLNTIGKLDDLQFD